MRTIFVSMLMLIAVTSLAQQKCASSDYLERQRSADPAIQAHLITAENFIHLQSVNGIAGNQAREDGNAVIHIPVVVHVLYSNSSQDISDLQVKSQIDALNRDYRRKNADTSNTPERFKAIAADIQIEFQLATADPDGRATTGIIHKQTSTVWWTSDDKIKYSENGGDNAWDSRSYLNIWVGNLFGVLGYSSIPGGPADKDGIVINTNAFGTVNVSAPYNMGRTGVHEVGHWLGLKHVWGDTYCGDDLVDDTPRQGNFTSGCPGGTFRSSCDNGPMGDMYMNYMDFTDDACINLFTLGQKQRMLAVFNPGGPRNSLFESKGLDVPWKQGIVSGTPAATADAVASTVYPNPAQDEITLNLGSSDNFTGQYVSVVNIYGTMVDQVILKAAVQKINISRYHPGIYILRSVKSDRNFSLRFIKL